MTELVAAWDGEHFVPLKRFDKLCASTFVIGERYILEIGMQQSATKRAMFHATLNDIYSSLPDDIASRYLNVDHFRKSLAIQTGFATEQQEVCSSKAEAIRLAEIIRGREPYSLVTTKDNIVTIWTALSTAGHAMDGKKFSECVDAVLAKAGDMIGVSAKDLKKEHAKDKLNPALTPDQGPIGDASPASLERAAASPPSAAARDLAISALPETDGISAYDLQDGKTSVWLRSAVIDFIDDAKEITSAKGTNNSQWIKAIGGDRTVFFKVSDVAPSKA